MRHLEQTTLYPQPDGEVWQDEWAPYQGPDTSRWVASSFKAFVRRFNRDAKQRGDNTRLRSVETEEE